MINLGDHPIGTLFATRSGRTARLLAKDLLGEHPFVAAVMYGHGVEGTFSYRADGTTSALRGGAAFDVDIVGPAPISRKARVLVLPSPIVGARAKSFLILDDDPAFDQPYPSAILDRTIDWEMPAPALVPVEQKVAA